MTKLPAGIMPNFREHLPDILVRNEGHWVWHETVRPGVYKHIADSGEECLTARIVLPPNGRLSSRTLRLLADLIDEYAEGGRRTSRNGFELIGVRPDRLDELVVRLNEAGFPLGSTGASLRQIKSCPGFVHCQNALVDAPSLAKAIGDRFFQDAVAQSYPAPLKVSISGCSNQCGGGVEADIGLSGVFLDPPLVDDEAVNASPSDVGLVCSWCPTGAIRPKSLENGVSVEINKARCVRCGSCAMVCPAGITIGKPRGLQVMIGGKSGTGSGGPRLARTVIPFVPVEEALRYDEVLGMIDRVIEIWKSRAVAGERLGDFIERIGWPAFFRMTGLPFDGRSLDRCAPGAIRRNLLVKDGEAR